MEIKTVGITSPQLFVIVAITAQVIRQHHPAKQIEQRIIFPKKVSG